MANYPLIIPVTPFYLEHCIELTPIEKRDKNRNSRVVCPEGVFLHGK